MCINCRLQKIFQAILNLFTKDSYSAVKESMYQSVAQFVRKRKPEVYTGCGIEKKDVLGYTGCGIERKDDKQKNCYGQETVQGVLNIYPVVVV